MMTALLLAPDPRIAREPAAGSGADRAIRVSTTAAVLAVAGVAAYVSYWHAYAVVRAYGEAGITARLEPATIDGLVYASSMVNLYAARHRLPVPALARWLLALGIVATLAANMAQGWSHGPVGAVIAAWPAASLVGSYELLVWIIRTAVAGGPARGPAADHTCDQPRTGPWHPAGPAQDAGPERRYGQNARLAAVTDHVPEPLVRADQRSGPHPDHADQPNQPDQAAGQADAAAGQDPVPEGPSSPGTADDDIAAAVAAYRSSVRQGAPLSERKLGGMFGKSRRWARSRIAEVKLSPVPA